MKTNQEHEGELRVVYGAISKERESGNLTPLRGPQVETEFGIAKDKLERFLAWERQNPDKWNDEFIFNTERDS